MVVVDISMWNIQMAINIKTKVPPPAAASASVTSCVDVTTYRSSRRGS